MKKDARPFEVEYLCPMPSGMDWFKVRIVPFLVGSERCVFVSHDNITDKQSLRHTLDESARRERERWACDLHDGLGQSLTGASLLLAGLVSSIHGIPEAQRNELRAVASILSDAVAECRSLALSASPTAKARGGLVSALQNLCITFATTHRCSVNFRAPASSPALDDFVSEHFYWIAQESLTNSLQHSKATRIGMSLQALGDRTVLSVTNHGTGISAAANHAGMGQRVMRYRTAQIGASLKTTATKSGGTRTRLCWVHGDIQRSVAHPQVMRGGAKTGRRSMAKPRS